MSTNTVNYITHKTQNQTIEYKNTPKTMGLEVLFKQRKILRNFF